MNAYIILSLAALARVVSSTRLPTLGFNPNTAADCVEWYNNREGTSCSSVLNEFGITPAEFSKWNPSVDLNCQPWYEWQSYCLITKEKLDKVLATRTTSTTVATTTTTSASTLGPSPTAWTSRGCYVEDPKLPILDQNMSGAGGDAALTIPKCKNSCYRRAYGFAGVQAGNQCWCGTYIGGQWAKNQTDCNLPCTGDKSTFCGGKGLLNIFQAAPADQVPVTSASTVTSASAKVTTTSKPA